MSTPLRGGTRSPADAPIGCLKTDRADGLWSTVIVDVNGVAVGFAYSDRERLTAALTRRLAVHGGAGRAGVPSDLSPAGLRFWRP